MFCNSRAGFLSKHSDFSSNRIDNIAGGSRRFEKIKRAALASNTKRKKGASSGILSQPCCRKVPASFQTFMRQGCIPFESIPFGFANGAHCGEANLVSSENLRSQLAPHFGGEDARTHRCVNGSACTRRVQSGSPPVARRVPETCSSDREDNGGDAKAA